MTLESGSRLGPYEILSPIGAGGMGEVYVAGDTKLSRKVALKVLPPEMAENAERRARFEREAKAVAALDHPNIVTIYSVEEAEGVHFYTMQLVKGKTLTELIPKKGMPLNKFFEISIPLADAVSAAHEQGIIHRDLKPDNLMVGDDGRLKILDFGLAKLKPQYAEEGASELPTQSATAEGRILGTVAYMSPEQAEGKTVDHRSDIFSMGIILYEMATGERPFKGDTAVSLLSSILKDTPTSVTSLNHKLPSILARIIKRCLVKDAEHRYQTAKDVRNELEELKQDIDSGEVTQELVSEPPSRVHSKGWLGLAMLGLLVVAGLSYWFLRSNRMSREKQPLVKRSTQLTTEAGQLFWPNLSPDGNFLVYASDSSGIWDIYFQRVGGKKAIQLTHEQQNDMQPALSPDGEQIAFRSERDGEGIYVMGATGEAVKRLTDEGHDPSWSPDGKKILYTLGIGSDGPQRSTRSSLWSVNVSTGERHLVSDEDIFQPRWSPNQHRIAYYVAISSGQVDIWTMSADGENPVPVTNDSHHDWNPIWSPDGSCIYFTSNRGGSSNIWRVRIDEETGLVLREPEPVTIGTGAGLRHLSIAGNGVQLAYVSSTGTTNIQKVSFDPIAEKIDGRPVPVTTRGALHPSVSPDGEWLAFDFADAAQPGAVVISVIRTDGTDLKQLTDTSYRDRFPRWSPDGTRIAFRSNRDSHDGIWVMNADGSDQRPVCQGAPATWSPDGLEIVTMIAGEGAYICDANEQVTESNPKKLPALGEEGEGVFMPWSWSDNGKSLAGHNFGRRVDLVVYSFENQKYRKLNALGSWPVWLSDNGRLIYMSSPDRPPYDFSIMDTATGKHHVILSAEILGIAPDRLFRWADISPDDRAIYFERRRDEADIWMLTLNEQ